uniref:Uncharacterized protein n=1 Tax=Amphimedon queenslandica TaxID=400682 RepID=A0A1X7UUN6_AMPQE
MVGDICLGCCCGCPYPETVSRILLAINAPAGQSISKEPHKLVPCQGVAILVNKKGARYGAWASRQELQQRLYWAEVGACLTEITNEPLPNGSVLDLCRAILIDVGAE